MKVVSPAKVNLGLWIKGKRADGYHELITVFHAIDLCDEIYIKEGVLRVATSSGIPMEENLVFKALMEYERRTGREVNFSIYIKKNIPAGSGLGGGSSNVAKTLLEVNKLMGNLLEEEELTEIASMVSSDAAFFIKGGTALGRGRGEILKSLKPLHLSVTLVIPRVHASTKRVYSEIKEEDINENIEAEDIIEALEENRFELLENRLGEVACRVYPEIGEVVRFLEQLGIKALVSGSGSAVFYIGEPSAELLAGARLRGWKVIRSKSWLGV